MKKRIIILIGLIITILGAYISFSYALFEKTETQTDNNTISTYNCLDLSIEGEENINITSAFPIEDEEGLLQTPYKFKVKNKCDHYVETEIGIELQSNNTLGDEYLRFKMNEVSEYEDGSIYLLSEKRRYNEVEGENVLDSKYPIIIDELNGNEEKEYELRVWIPYTAGNEVMNKNFKGKVYVSGIVKTDPKYYINTIEDLVTLSNEVNSGNSYEGVTVVLTKDLDFNNDNSYANATRTDFGDLNEDGTVEGIKTELTKETGKGFTPIGTKDNNFMGNFDGQNHRLDNIYINNSTLTYIGLFGYINNSSMSNLTLSGIVKTTIRATTGGIISVANGNSSLNNLVNEVNVTSELNEYSVGGVVGSSDVDAILNINNCINKGTISGGIRSAGILGYNFYKVNINNSHNEGQILQITGTIASGIIGSDRYTNCLTTIKNSYNSGNILLSSNDSSDRLIGGLIGNTSGILNVYNSYNNGNVSYDYDYANNTLSTVSRIISVGGIAGGACKGVIENSYNLNNISNGNISNGNWVGGIIGTRGACNEKLIINRSYNLGNVTGGYNNHVATPNCGGIVGRNQGDNLYILNSYNNGEISANTVFVLGGLAGYANKPIKIINSYNSGNISSNDITSGILGFSYINSIINNVFNSGILSTTVDKKFAIADGGITNVTNAYFLTSTGLRKADLGTPLTSAEIAGREFVSTLNKNVNSIKLSDISSDLAGYKLSSWIYDPSAGHPVLDNSN